MFSPSRPECFTWLSLLITESIIIVTFNVVTIIIFTRNRSLRTRGMYLVINLAVADIMSGAFSESMVFVYLGGQCDFWKYNLTGNWRKLSVAIELLFPVSSVTAIVAISLQQLHAIFRPFQHRVIKKRVYGVAIAIVWIVAALISTLQHLKINHLTLWISFTSICLFTICVSYTLTALKFVRGRNIRHHGSSIREKNWPWRCSLWHWYLCWCGYRTLYALFFWSLLPTFAPCLTKYSFVLIFHYWYCTTQTLL